MSTSFWVFLNPFPAMKPHAFLAHLYALTNWRLFPVQGSRLMVFLVTLRLYLRDGQCVDLPRRQFHRFIAWKVTLYGYLPF